MTNPFGINGELSVTHINNTSTVKEISPIRIQTASQNQSQDEMSYLERKAEIKRAVTGINEFLKATPSTNLQFKFHEDLGEYYVALVDELTNEVVREIPPKKMLDMFAAMTDYIGLMVDKKI